MTLYKTLDGLEATHGGSYRYPDIGRWARHLDPERLNPCVRGYHLARDEQLLDWLAPTIYEAEACPEHEWVDGGDKLVTCRVRLIRRLQWDDRIARLFAADVGESVLLGEIACGREPDERSWAAIEAARAYARGEISGAALNTAEAAARAAARDAAAARAAAWAAAARAAARAAAEAAAWAATRAATRAAVYSRLRLYLEGWELPPVEPLYGRSG